jgi:hypothetical protein
MHREARPALKSAKLNIRSPIITSEFDYSFPEVLLEGG